MLIMLACTFEHLVVCVAGFHGEHLLTTAVRVSPHCYHLQVCTELVPRVSCTQKSNATIDSKCNTESLLESILMYKARLQSFRLTMWKRIGCSGAKYFYASFLHWKMHIRKGLTVSGLSPNWLLLIVFFGSEGVVHHEMHQRDKPSIRSSALKFHCILKKTREWNLKSGGKGTGCYPTIMCSH